MKKHSFEPFLPDGATILILGSLPGDRSLASDECYGHPQNRFWKVLAHLTNSPVPGTYADKLLLLSKNRIALWDVARAAERSGSMDSKIRNVLPNDIGSVLKSHPAIRTIGFNGKKAAALFDRYFPRHEHIRYIQLPSTSPANAAWRLPDLCSAWSKLLEPESVKKEGNLR